ncbi:MAG: Cna B-type domain-containing protein, partial [Tissierellia bacterium]|nr:Cna B-type domain-containing protein [Tissierellia bacterium]
MKIKVKKMYQKFLSILLATLMFFSTSVPGMQVFAQELDGGNQTTHEVKFVTEPQDTKITVKDADNKKVEPSKDDEHIFHLKEGSYIYSASAQGYKPVEDKEFKVEKNEEIKVELIKEEAVSDSELEKSSQSMRVTSQNIGAKALSIADINNYSFSIVDRTHDNAIIEHKKEGEEGYSDYLNNPSKFNQVVGKDEKISGLSVNFSFSYSGSEGIKEGDTLEIPAYLGTELQNASFANVPLADTSGVTLGTYSYNSGKFILSFSGEHVKNDNVQNFSALLTSSSVSVPNTTFGTGTNGEKTVIHGKVLDTNIIAGYEKKNADAPVGPRPLSLDNVRIKSFKIIDVANGNKEIDYKTSDDPEYNEYKNNPTRFTNAIHQDQKNSKIKFQLSVKYDSVKSLLPGDTLTIPAHHGGHISSFTSKPLFDGTKHQLGTWKYSNGNVVVSFGGDYIKNNIVKAVEMSFETGEIQNLLLNEPKTFVPGERNVHVGKLGKNDIVVPFEKELVVAQKIGETREYISKYQSRGTDSLSVWAIRLSSDSIPKTVNGKRYHFNTPYLLENNGNYNPKAWTDVYVEDAFTDLTKAPRISYLWVPLGGVTDNGELIGGQFGVSIKLNDLTKALTEVKQGNKSKLEVKNALKNGQYSIFNNGDETYTFMMKWWDMNDSSGFTYDKIPSIADAGGVGNYLKEMYSEVFENLKPETIAKINDLYNGKAVQEIITYIDANYTPVKEAIEITNTAKITTKQTGEKEYPAVGKLTPPAEISDAPANPLSIKLIKSDRRTGEMLSEGFKFELQTTTNNGNTWTKVKVDASMLDKGRLDGDQLVPDDKGIVQVKGLKVGKYRFVETAHPAGYMDVAIDDANPNSTKYPKSANSKVIELNNQGTSKVVAMYNEPNAEKIEIKVTKAWVGPEKDAVIVKLLADDKDTGKTLTLNKVGNWEGKFTNLDKLNINGGEIKYDVAEVEIDNYTSTKTGNTKTGFIITNKHTPPTTPKKEVFKGNETTNIDGKEVKAGEVLTYKVSYKNTTGKEQKVVIEDMIPEFTSYVEGSATNGGVYQDGKITWTKDKVADGESFEVSFKVKVERSAGGENLKNEAIVNAGKNKLKTNPTTNPVPEIPPTTPKKEVFKGNETTNIDGKEVKAGEVLTYKVSYKNTTGKEQKVVIEDMIPEFTSYVEGSATNGGVYQDGKITWTKDKVADGESFEVSFKVKVERSAGGENLKNEAIVNAGKNKLKTNPTTNPVPEIPPTTPKKEVFKGNETTNIDGKEVKAGEVLTYKVSYKNTTGKEQKVVIEDMIPEFTSYVEGSATNGGVYQDGKITWTKDKVADGESFEVSFKVKVERSAGGENLKNEAIVNAGKNKLKTNPTTNPVPEIPPTTPKKEVFKGNETTNI